VHSELSKTQDEIAEQIDLHEVGLKHLLEKKNNTTSGSKNFISTKISQMTSERQTLSNKKKKIEDIKDNFYTVILKNGAIFLAVNAKINADPEANDYTILSAEDVKEFEALKRSHKELVSVLQANILKETKYQ
jgi:hypothetical protein